MEAGCVPIDNMKEKLLTMFRNTGEEQVITETVFRNSCAWAVNFALVTTGLIYGLPFLIGKDVELLEVVQFCHFTMFSGIVCLQGFYLGGKCRFLNSRPYTRGYKRHTSSSGE